MRGYFVRGVYEHVEFWAYGRWYGWGKSDAGVLGDAGGVRWLGWVVGVSSGVYDIAHDANTAHCCGVSIPSRMTEQKRKHPARKEDHTSFLCYHTTQFFVAYVFYDTNEFSTHSRIYHIVSFLPT